MASEIPTVNWQTFLTLYWEGQIVPMLNMRYRIGTEARELDITTAHLVGWHDLPPRFEFTAQIYAVGDVALLLQRRQLDRVDLSFGVAARAGTDWAFASIGFNNCRIVETSGEGIAADGVAILSVRVKCLQFALGTTNVYPR